MHRRDYLRLWAAVATVGVAGCGGSPPTTASTVTTTDATGATSTGTVPGAETISETSSGGRSTTLAPSVTGDARLAWWLEGTARPLAREHGTVYADLVDAPPGVDPGVWALDPADGSRRWRAGGGIADVAGGVVLHEHVGAEGQQVDALTAPGEVGWTAAGSYLDTWGETAVVRGPMRPGEVGDGTVSVRLRGVSVTTGETAWERAVLLAEQGDLETVRGPGPYLLAEPARGQPRGPTLLRMDPDSGRVEWRHSLDHPAFPVAGPQGVYLEPGGDDAPPSLRCVGQDGDVLFDRTYPDRRELEVGYPAFVGEHLVLDATDRGGAYGVDPSTGELTWGIEPDQAGDGPFQEFSRMRHGRFWLQAESSDGLVAVDPATGERGEPLEPAALAGGEGTPIYLNDEGSLLVVVVGTGPDEADTIGVDPDTGRQHWRLDAGRHLEGTLVDDRLAVVSVGDVVAAVRRE